MIKKKRLLPKKRNPSHGVSRRLKKKPKWLCPSLVTWCSVRGEAARLALALGVSNVQVSRWVKGTQKCPAERCLEIARATNGAVQPIELRPDIDWSTS